MARGSLLIAGTMATRNPPARRCSYVVLVQNAAASTGGLRDLAGYLSMLSVAGCDVVVLDDASPLQFEIDGRILRWVGRHVAPAADHRVAEGIDIVRAALAFAACDKVIVAADDVRYTAEAIGQICELLDMHEVVEPQDYLDPLPLWASVEAARMLIHRGVAPQPGHGTTFGFRRGALRALRALGPVIIGGAQTRRLAAVRAEVHAAGDVFVRREPGSLADWISARPHLASNDFTSPLRSAFYFSLLPLFVLLAALGGPRMASAYAGMVAFAAIGVAVRGRVGASAFFPLHACLAAPVWILERAVSVYWALCRKLRGAPAHPQQLPVTDRASGTRAASGQ